MKNKLKNTGFTIVELLVVISIIALLIGILVPAVQKARDSAKVTQSKSNIHNVTIALQNYSLDHGDRNFSTAPDNLSSGDRTGMDIEDAIDALNPDGYAATEVMGISLGQYEAGNAAYVYYIGMFGNGGNETGGIAPYCFGGGLTTSSTGKVGYGVWRYPNSGQVADYMKGRPLHPVYFAPKDVIPNRALEACTEATGTYCPSTQMANNHGTLNPGDALWVSNLLQAPSSYCISPALMYSPSVYQWNPIAGKAPRDPMSIPRGFKPPSTDQARYPAHKTWLMEHSWLQNLDNNDCGVNWDPAFGSWFLSGDGTWDGCEPEHFNGSRHSEPVASLADGSTVLFNVADAAADSITVSNNDPFNTQGLWIADMPFDNQEGYWANYSTDWVHWSGHTHTLDGIRGRDKLAK
jgi:prepilin-type N-terminal cleavage/methylation domain-containing protein